MDRDQSSAAQGPGTLRDAGNASLTRRRFLTIAVWGAAAAAFPRIALASAPERVRRLSFYNLHTDERLATVYWENGGYVPGALEQIDAILRDHRTGDVRPIATGLVDLLHALTARLRTRQPVQVVSGYRSPATNAMLRSDDPAGVSGNSLHLTGEALDLCVGDRSLRAVRDAALSLRAGGVGYYPKTGFVHIDIGRPRSW